MGGAGFLTGDIVVLEVLGYIWERPGGYCGFTRNRVYEVRNAGFEINPISVGPELASINK